MRNSILVRSLAVSLFVIVGSANLAQAQDDSCGTYHRLKTWTVEETKRIHEYEIESAALKNEMGNYGDVAVISAVGVVICAAIFEFDLGAFKIDLGLHGDNMRSFLNYMRSMAKNDGALNMAKSDFRVLIGASILEIGSAAGLTVSAIKYAKLNSLLDERALTFKADKEILAQKKERVTEMEKGFAAHSISCEGVF